METENTKNIAANKSQRAVSFIHEPTDLQCGQAVLAMLLGRSVSEIVAFLNNDRETTLKEMKQVLAVNNMICSDTRKQAYKKEDLPQVCILSLETPRCWHWSLYHYGVFYDPEHGVMDDFPDSARKYFWEVREDY
ncbi:MAG: hypothetical protein Q4F95_09880 [Oscillospiraceae bacterium]|nr:hypothetical protein [Oscillospiraceae bacterium]